MKSSFVNSYNYAFFSGFPNGSAIQRRIRTLGRKDDFKQLGIPLNFWIPISLIEFQSPPGSLSGEMELISSAGLISRLATLVGIWVSVLSY